MTTGRYLNFVVLLACLSLSGSTRRKEKPRANADRSAGRDDETNLSTRRLALHHVNFGAILVVFHLVHQLVHQIDSASMVGEEVFACGRHWQ